MYHVNVIGNFFSLLFVEKAANCRLNCGHDNQNRDQEIFHDCVPLSEEDMCIPTRLAISTVR